MIRAYLPVQSPKFQQELRSPGYRYREYAPSQHLAPYVACYWTVDYESHPKGQLHRIIPDGCVDIIVNRLSPSCWKAAFVAGLMTSFEVLTLSRSTSLFGIRFFLETAHHFLKNPLSSFIGHRVFLEEIWGLEEIYFVEEILLADTTQKIVEVVEHKLLQILSSNQRTSLSLIHSTMQFMYAMKGNLTISNIAEEINFSERHLRRTFDHELGVSPKQLLGIIRFQCMLQEFYYGSKNSLAHIALKYGYYDQSHFIKNFKRYYGLSPKQLT